MHDLIYALGYILINADFIFLFIALFGVILTCLGKTKGVWVASPSLIMIGLIQCSTFAIWPGKFLEDLAPKPSYNIDDIEGFILLGGSYARGATPEKPLFNLAGSRLVDFLALVQNHPTKKVIFTGSPMEAEITKEYFKKFGINPDRIIVEAQSRGTADHPKNLASIIDVSKKWVLVTSAFHMHRSLKLFYKHRFHVEPHPVDYHVPLKWEFNILKGGGIYWGATMKEFAALIHLRLEN